VPVTRLHIGIDATSWPNDRGFGRFTRELIKALLAREEGFQYTLLFDQRPAGLVPRGARVLSAETERSLNDSAVGKSSRSFAYFLKMVCLARKAKCDVFFFPTLYSYFPLPSRTPCIVCYHDATAERLPELLFPTKLNHWLWRAKTALARMQTTRAMTVSQASAQDLATIHNFHQSRIDVVTEAADPVFRVLDDPALGSNARPQYGIPEDAFLLVHVGGMNAHKNILGLLRAMLLMSATDAKTHLAIVGDTSGKGFWDNVEVLKAFIRDHPPLSSRVHFTGYINDAALAELLNGAQALVFPSLWEGFGLPAVEAMSCGIPVLASRRGSLPEVVGDAGLFFDPDDPQAIAACVSQFFHDDALRARLSRNALARARLFTWARAAELAELSFHRCYDEARGSRTR
jgi:alpha-1,3-rhamnosyl/mannosyltransferase